MLRPSKHSHPDMTVVNVAFLLLPKIKRERICKYEDLLNYLRGKMPGSRILYLPSLNFLFLLGLIKYHQKTDSFEYVGPA
jgi:ABC-three component (ABC-3C) system Middle Component 8